MPYSEEERQAALARLAANNGNVQQTSAQTGISARSLRRWAQQAPAQVEQPAPVSRRAQRPTSTDGVSQQVYDHLLLTLLADAIRLAESLEPVIDEAPLNQRATALNQLIDKILKLLEALPPAEERAVQVEYVWPDHTIHDAPPWTAGDPDESGAL
jgi:hypothetical protein